MNHMKKIYSILILCIGLIACNNTNTDSEYADADSLKSQVEDSLNTPGGVINSSPISTDTAAMNVQNSLKAAKDSAR